MVTQNLRKVAIPSNPTIPFTEIINTTIQLEVSCGPSDQHLYLGFPQFYPQSPLFK